MHLLMPMLLGLALLGVTPAHGQPASPPQPPPSDCGCGVPESPRGPR